MSQAGQAYRRGMVVRGPGGQRIGSVDAVFADYLLVRTTGLLPVDLYVPITELAADEHGQPHVDRGRSEAYAAWHRPLKQAPHG